MHTKKEIILHSVLFLITFFTLTLSGVLWVNKDYAQLLNFHFGLQYSVSISIILLFHEFGHYFAARKHKVESSFPYFIPFPMTHMFINFGTLGAMIKTKSPIPNSKALFDIGIFGPFFGFIASIIILVIGFLTLPDENYIVNIHPNYFNQAISSTSTNLEFGSSLIFNFLKYIFTDSNLQFVPPMSEIYHYPLICAGWFGIFITMMNLIPIGQLDGGHIIYSMFPKQQSLIAKIFFGLLLFFGLISFVPIFSEFKYFGWSGWFFWALVLYFIVKLDHPIIDEYVELNFKRKILGWLIILVFIISFIPSPFPI